VKVTDFAVDRLCILKKWVMDAEEDLRGDYILGFVYYRRLEEVCGMSFLKETEDMLLK